MINDQVEDANTVLISVIIATYNAGKFIETSLNSIKNLNLQDLEVVIIDGGSTDNTLKILANFTNITIVTEKDKGIYDALNKGARLARGNWLYFMGADDRLYHDFREAAAALKKSDTLYYANTEAIFLSDNRPDYELLSGKFNAYRLAKYCINHQAVIYPARVFEKYAYNLDYKVFADYALNLEVWGDKDFKKEYLPLTIGGYNMSGFSSTFTDISFKRDKADLIKKHLGWLVYLRYRWKKLRKRLKGEDWY